MTARQGMAHFARHALHLAGGGHHFRGWRFAGGQRGGQGIATRQRGGDGKRAGGPPERIGIQAAADDVLDRGIDIGGDGGHAGELRRIPACR